MENLKEDVLEVFAEAQAQLPPRRARSAVPLEGVATKKNGAVETKSSPGGSTPLFSAAEVIELRPKHPEWNAPERDGKRLCPGYGRSAHWSAVSSFTVDDRVVGICAECREWARARKLAKEKGFNLAIVEEVDNARGEMKLVVWARGAYRYDEARLMISGTGSLSPGDRVWIGQVDDSRQEGGKRWEIERVSYRSKETAWRRA